MLDIMMLTLAALAGPAEPPAQSLWPGAEKLAVLCFYQGEHTSGLNKICFYDCLGSQAAITVRATSLCPQTINR